MNKPIQPFALEDATRGRGLSCDASGVALAGTPLLTKTPAGLQPRAAHELDLLLTAAYAARLDTRHLARGLAVAAEALNAGDLERAMIGALHLRLPPLDERASGRLAKVDDLLAKYNYNPAEPRDWRGRWTDGGGSTPPPTAEAASSPAVPHQHGQDTTDDLLTPVAYNGVFHDQAVREYAAILRSRGETVVTEVGLTMADGSAGARLDILARDPTTGIIYGVEVKTGDRPGFTPGQIVVYPHFMMGESVIADTKAAAVGLLPNVPLPPIPLYLMYQRNALTDRVFTELDPLKMSRYYRGH